MRRHEAIRGPAIRPGPFCGLRQSRLVACATSAKPGIRLSLLTAPFRPVDPLLCAHGASTNKAKHGSPRTSGACRCPMIFCGVNWG